MIPGDVARPGLLLRRAAASVLLLFATLPIYRLLDTSATGSIGEFTLGVAQTSAAYLWLTTLVLALPALLLAGLLPLGAAAAALRRGTSLLLRLPLAAFAAACALIAFSLALWVNQRVLAGQPNLTDAIAQLVQARYVAAGRLAGPVPEFAAFWNVPLMLFTPAGWVSHFPPGHVMLLALGFRLGAVHLVGPVLLGLTVYLTALIAHQLFARDLLVARLGTVLLAFSPFAAAHAAAYMNHTAAGCFAALAVYAAVRLFRGNGWAAAAVLGLALAALFATRPLSAVVVAAVLAISGLWLRRHGTIVPSGFRLFVIILAAVPIGLLLGYYNAHFFGSPFRFGYTAALGPSAGLGFGIDPWGNAYNLKAALGYTAAELTALNVFLLESPVPVVVLAALFLLLERRLEGPVRFVAAWALLPLLAHLCYWHHGMHMGPRMLNEYAPAWCLLVAAAAVGLVRLVPATLAGSARWSPRIFLGALLLGAWLYALVDGSPRRLVSYRKDPSPAQGLAGKVPDRALVFVHGGWRTRVAMQLAAGGMRHDSLEILMSRNSTCALQRWFGGERDSVDLEAEWRTDGQEQTSAFEQREVAPGSGIQVRPGEPWPAECARQAAADAFGVTEVATFLWNTGLPELDDKGTWFVRDLGPSANARLLAALQRPSYVLQVLERPARVRLLPYEEGMAAIWRGLVP